MAPRVTEATDEVRPLIGPVLESTSGGRSSTLGELKETTTKSGRPHEVKEKNRMQLAETSSVHGPGVSGGFSHFSDDCERANKLAEDLWDPALFPEQAIRDQLKSHYHEVLRKRRARDILPLELEEDEDGEDEDDEGRDERYENENGDEGEDENEDRDEGEGEEGEGGDEEMDEDERKLHEAEKLKAEERIKHGREVLEGAMSRVRKVVEEQQSLRVGMRNDTRPRSGSASSDETGYAKEDRQWDLSWVLAAE